MEITSYNQRKSAYQEFIKIHNDKLQILSPLGGTSFGDLHWNFKYKASSPEADFSIFNRPYTQFLKTVEVKYNGENINLTIVEFAKILWLSLLEDCVPSQKHYHSVVNISLLFSYLKSKKATVLTKSDLTGLYRQMLTADPTNDGLISRFSVPAYATRLKHFNVMKLLRTMHAYGINSILIPNITIRHYLESFNSACQSVLGMTLTDYKKGGSFNFLGLDIGRHYIDFCADFFENHIAYATACRMTLENISEKIKKEIKYKREGNIKYICAETLMGVTVEDMYSSTKMTIAKKTMREIHERSTLLFCHFYNEISDVVNPFKLEKINEIVNIFGSEVATFDMQEFIRAMMFTRYYGTFAKSREKILQEFKASQKASGFLSNYSLEQFDIAIDTVLRKSNLTPSSALQTCRDHYHQCNKSGVANGEHKFREKRYLNSVLLNVESAGTTVFSAMTGWRASEFGFSINCIDISVNQEVLDSAYSPFRFHVKWVVPKTSGKTPLEREITLASYILAKQLESFNCNTATSPCLYRSNTDDGKESESKSPVEKRVGRLWPGFCLHYQLFTELDELQQLNEKAKLTSKEQKRNLELQKRYDLQSSRTCSLLDMRDKLRIDLRRYIISRNVKSSSFKELLIQYQKNTLTDEKSTILDQYLSQETKHALKVDLIQLNTNNVRVINAEFLEGVVYPTAHALRHMWAEAVLRRYRGDIGKYIRANFKHLDESFFMAYLRDKETSMIFEVAKRNVINSIVREHLMSQKDNNREYAGGFDSYLSKVVKATKIISNEEYIKVAKTISDERIIDIQGNAWATCLLRVGTSQSAKCSIAGIPQRRNASPKFCLSCVNGNVSEGNFNGIVVYTRPEVEACRNPELPFFIKSHCVDVLKPALAQVKKLRKNSGNIKYDNFIAHLEESIEMAKKTEQEEK